MSATVAPLAMPIAALIASSARIGGLLGLALGPHQPRRSAHAHDRRGLAAGDGMHVLAAGQQFGG
jgi:hypothetical protein